MLNRYILGSLIIYSLLAFGISSAFAQAELEPWGNLRGIRKQGQLFPFETCLKVVSSDGLKAFSTAKERQRPNYIRNGRRQIVITNLDSLYFKEMVTNRFFGGVKINIQVVAKTDMIIKAGYFCLAVPYEDFMGGKLQFDNTELDSAAIANPVNFNCKRFEFITKQRKLLISFNSPMPVMLKNGFNENKKRFLFYFMLAKGALHKGDSLEKTITIKVSGGMDKSPVNIAVDTAGHGRPFDGLGGNFRLQNAKNDPPVIDYALANLRVAIGRIELPWRFWQPLEVMDPRDSAKMAPAVIKAMEMAQRLDRMGIPIILSAWFPPSWAVVGNLNLAPVNGIWGNPLNPDKLPEIYKSITDYIIYLKVHYGAEVKYFSFNESDLGINIRQTGQQHDELIKGLGAYFASHGLNTKMLLGDNSDATTYRFIYPALNDADALPYIGAVSFHSWRGCDQQTLKKWAEASRQLNVPLIVGEGSIDAQAWSYPQIFEEPTYALQEIELYIQLLNQCQPQSILQWQLTSDYSPLIGGGIYGNNTPLHPGQRFFNLKQLASTPPHLFAMNINCDDADITCAALGDLVKNTYALHLVNNGPKRQVTITGIPATCKLINIYVTNKKQQMQKKSAVPVNGTLTLKLKATSFYSFLSL